MRVGCASAGKQSSQAEELHADISVMKKLSLASFLLFSMNAFAAPPTISGASGLSRYSNLKTPVVFGGMVGTVEPTDGAHTVDTCTMNGQVLRACNTESIYGSLELRVFAKHRNIGNLLLTHEGSMVPLSSRNNPDFVGVRWDSLCQVMAGGNCDMISSTASLTSTMVSLRSGTW
jgi:hypothetical protein